MPNEYTEAALPRLRRVRDREEVRSSGSQQGEQAGDAEERRGVANAGSRRRAGVRRQAGGRGGAGVGAESGRDERGGGGGGAAGLVGADGGGGRRHGRRGDDGSRGRRHGRRGGDGSRGLFSARGAQRRGRRRGGRGGGWGGLGGVSGGSRKGSDSRKSRGGLLTTAELGGSSLPVSEQVQPEGRPV